MGLPSGCAQEVTISIQWHWNAFYFLLPIFSMCNVEHQQEQWLSKAAVEEAQAEKDHEHIYSVMEELGLGR